MAYMNFGLKIHRHPRQTGYEMNKSIQKTEIPEWMTKEKTTLIQKYLLKGTNQTTIER